MLKSLVRLWTVMAEDLAIGCHTSASRDSKTVASRVEDEGLSFLTITLPSFCSDFERSLDEGSVGSTAFIGFRRRGGLPLFLGGFLNRIFDTSGALKDEPCLDSIFAVRQLTLLCKKLNLPCSDARVKKAIEGYVLCEQEVAAWTCSAEREEQFSQLAFMLFGRELIPLDQEIYEGSLIPKHGPGATADRISANRKYDLREWTLRLEELFPYLENALPSSSYYKEQDRVTFLEPEAERPVRVITVPKTLKTPRIIAIEPTCMQYMQQAILESLIEKLEGRESLLASEEVGRGDPFPGNEFFVRKDVGLKPVVDSWVNPAVVHNEFDERMHGIAHYFVGFTDQHPNRVLARMGSVDRKIATLDLSEASDRVSNRHVELLLARFPWLSKATQATRSLKADVPGHGVIPLSKFASMGSALCFPMEAMVFTTVVFMGIQRALNKPLTRKDLFNFRGQVRVYGDDIIVPVEYVSYVIEELEAFGFRVNSKKSFWNGSFRESCGGEYFKGVDITPIKLKHPIPESRKDVSAVVSSVAFRNLIYKRGMWKTAAFVDDQIGKILPHFPIVHETSSALGRFSYLPDDTFFNVIQRVGGRYQTPLVKAFGIRNVIRRSPLDDYPALQKFFLRRGTEPLSREHLERSGRPESVDIKLRWRAKH